MQLKSRVGTPGTCRNWLALRGPNGPQEVSATSCFQDRTKHIYEKHGKLGWVLGGTLGTVHLLPKPNNVQVWDKMMGPNVILGADF